MSTTRSTTRIVKNKINRYTKKKKEYKFAERDLAFDIVNNILITIILISVLYPLYFVVIASFSEPLYVSGGKVWLYPKGFTLKGYEEIFKYKMIWIGYRNTAIYTFVGTCINLTLTLPAGYVLSRKDFYGRNVIMKFLIIPMYFSGGLIPTFLLVRSLNLYNTFWVMVILGAVGIWNIIICKTYFSSNIPQELWESASIDGCKNSTFFLKIVLPLSKPIIAVMALFYGINHWNEYMRALIYLKDRNLHTLQLVLRDILIINSLSQEMREADYDLNEFARLEELIRYGTIIVASVPFLVIYPFLQKYFIKGIMIGSLKG